MSQKETDPKARVTLPTLDQLLLASRSVVWFATPDPLALIELNPTAVRVFDRRKSELLSNPVAWLEAIHPDDRHLFETLSKTVPQRGNLQLQYRVLQEDGEVRWLDDNVTWYPATDGGVPMIGGVATDVTDSRQQQQRLRESNDVLTGLIQQLPMNVLRKDLQGRIVFANQRFCDAIGLPLRELVGKTDFDLYPAELAKKYTDDDRRVLESGLPIEEFEKHQNSDGSTVYVQVRKGPAWDERGNPLGLQIMFWDATDRKRAEAALQYERNLLHALLDNGPDSIYFKDKDSRFIRASRGLAEKFRLNSPGDVLGKSDADFFSDQHSRATREVEMEIMRGGDPMLSKEELETWNEGEDTWSSTTKMALHDPDGEVIGTFGISRDITDKKQAQAELARERDLLKTIIDNVPDLVFAKDRAGRFILANTALMNVLGVSSMDEVIGKTDYDFSQPELACEHVADDQIVMRTGAPLIEQEELSHGLDGTEVCRLVSRVPLRDRDGNVRGIVAIARDITRRRDEQERLQKAMESADKANQAKSEFLANMSHEIRTPLNAIIGMTNLILETEVTDTQQEFLSMVKESGATLLRVINDVLDFSKIEAGKLELDPIAFDLREQLGSTMKSLAFRAHEKSLELALRIPPEVPNVYFGDVGRLRQIIVNLVANATKFTETGEVVVGVRCLGASGRDTRLQFSVADTGIGISPEKCQSIFNEFEQADSSTTRRYGGTGLGLAISTRLVDLMGGRIWVESELGKGSTFRFEIPLEVTDENGLRNREAVVVGGTRVLIVDDNETNRVILEEMVSSWGMLPLQADSVASAQSLLSSAAGSGEEIQLILSDVHMPDSDGFDLTEWIRQQADFASSPVIMLSSGSCDDDAARRDELQVAHLTKPVKQSELFNTIVRLLGKGNGAGSLRRRSPTEPRAATQSFKILLAEDSFFNQKLATAILQQDGHTVEVAANGVEAIDRLDQGEFDLILMDVQMPEMDGLEATRQIRARELEQQSERIPIIAMTAHAFKGDREQCLRAGMDDYIAKPIDREGLYALIQSVVADRDEGYVLDFASGESDDSTTADVVDFEAGLRRVGGSHDTLKALALVLLEECPKLVQDMSVAINVRNAKDLQRAAHTLKGSSIHFQATQVVRAAEAMEGHGAKERFKDASEALPMLKSEVQKLEEAIREKFPS